MRKMSITQIPTIHPPKKTNTTQFITSKESKTLADKIRHASDKIMKRNYLLYKDLENK